MPLGVVQHGLQLIEVCESGYAVGPQHRQRAARTSEKVRRYLSSKSRVVSVKPSPNQCAALLGHYSTCALLAASL